LWRDADRVASLTIVPRFYESSPFRWLVGLLAVAAVAGSWRLATRQVHRRAQRLETAVRERTFELAAERDVVSRQNNRLAQLAEDRSQFMAGISHELRTPLTLIL